MGHQIARAVNVFYATQRASRYVSVEHPFAQPNLRLYNQMLYVGYSDHDLTLVSRCYDLDLQMQRMNFSTLAPAS